MADLKENITKLATVNQDYYRIIIDEWLTGRRQFADTPEHIATHLLSPDGFYDISTPQATAKLASKWQDFIKWDVRGKGRNYLAKAVTVRVGFDADKYYKSLENAIEKVVGANETLQEAEEQTSPEVEFIAQEIASQLIFAIQPDEEVDPLDP